MQVVYGIFWKEHIPFTTKSSKKAAFIVGQRLLCSYRLALPVSIIYCDEQDGEWYVSNKQLLAFSASKIKEARGNFKQEKGLQRQSLSLPAI